MRTVAILALMAMCSASSMLSAQMPTPEEITKAIEEQVQITLQATLKSDHRTLAKMTHPKVVEMIGGSDKYVKTVDKLVAKMKSEGWTMASATSAKPSKVVEAKDGLYVIVPTKVVMEKDDGIRVKQAGYLLGMSTDKGQTWTFVDGAGFKNRDAMRKIVPNLPASLELPKKESPVIERPQP